MISRRRSVGRPSLYPHVLGLVSRALIEPVVGTRHLTTAEWLPSFWSWPDQHRRRWQQERLAAVLTAAARDVPYYRSRIPRDEDPMSALAALAPVSKADIRENTSAFVSRRLDEIPHLLKRTGGTTGDPLQYPLDKCAWAQGYAANLHAHARAGYRYGERVVMFGGLLSLGTQIPPRLPVRIRHGLERHDFGSIGFDLQPSVSLERARHAARAPAGMWYGYAGTIAAMADALIDAGERVRAPTVIVTTAEPLQPAWRASIEAAFGRTVVDQYGCNDGGITSHSCAAGRWHIAENLSIVEVMDGDTPCPPGVEGDVTVTNLHATALPFLRYRVGDRAVLGDGECPCGRPGQTFERLSGREGDRLYLPDGRELSIFALYHVFTRTPDVRKWQVAQTAPDRITVRLDVRPGFDEAQADLIWRYARERMGDSVSVTVTTDEQIEQTTGGKQRIVVREISGLR